MRQVKILPASITLERAGAGVLYARSPVPLGSYPARLTDKLEEWARRAGDRTFVAERGPDGGWRRLTYADALGRTRRLAQALIDLGLSGDRPLAILSGQGIDHALMALAAMYSGVPYAPLAPAYSLQSRDFSALRLLIDRLEPGLVFASGGEAFQPALRLAAAAGARIVTSAPTGMTPTMTFAEMEARTPGPAVDDANARVTAGTIAKILFTSGSTGHPKGVINTQRMLCSNQEQLRTVLGFLADEPPVLCDWLPWNHTFGGNHNFGLTLYNGGTLYLDSGRPVPGQFDETLRNLREIAPTAYLNVPRGFEMLLPTLSADAGFREHFFSRLQMLFYAAAGLRQEIADAFVELSIETLGERLPWVTGLGATESAPFALCTGAQISPELRTSRIGVPVPGVELKVVPVGDRLEARLRGPNITPGYWHDDALTAAAFDEDGYYRMGDAIALADPDQPEQGFVFQGRLAEDFKLSTGTWVWVGPIRAKLLAALGDLAQDVVITGENRDFVGALIFPNVPAWRARARSAGVPHEGEGAAPLRRLLATPVILDDLIRRLQQFAVDHPGSSTAIRRAVLLDEPPSLDAREMTDKGSINQRAVLTRRAGLVDRLYDGDGTAGIIDITPEGQNA